MANRFLLLFFITFSLTSFGQKEYRPTKIGIVKSFTGKIDMSTQYDHDAWFSIKDDQSGMSVLFYWQNGCCCLGEDKYELPLKISDELYEKITSEDGWNNLKIKVNAKSTYGIACSGNSQNKKVIIWRPLEIVLVK
ncbi:MAG: hypothetical protein ACKO41_05290 [Sphingomonadales bacterium]